MLTRAATATIAAASDMGLRVLSRRDLVASGCTRDELRARIAAGRWQVVGRAIVLHNAELNRVEAWQAALVNCGPRAVLTSFTAAESLGLIGWLRAEIHILAPAGVAPPRVTGLPIVLHRTGRLDRDATMHPRRCHRLAPALLLAASSFASPRPGCGLLAAAVQQRLTSAAALRASVDLATRTRHRRQLIAAIDDIAMGAQALSEIDFGRLCRRHRLPPPSLQSIRVEPGGRRRYLDAEWTLPGGRRVAVEVDGAVHLTPRRWFDDQLRQNEIVLGGVLLLRFPSVVVRTEPLLIVRQLRRALGLGS